MKTSYKEMYNEMKLVARDQQRLIMKVMELGSDNKEVQKELRKYAKRVLNEQIFMAIV